MNPQTSAGPQALGYVYQVFRYSLYLLLENLNRPETVLFIERLDDIEITDEDGVYQAFQIKHVKTNLTDRGSDLWKTIRVWSKYIQDNEARFPGPLFVIATTGKAPKSSIASLLRNENRNEDEAYRRLIEVSETPSASLQNFIDPFLRLSPSTKRLLVNAIRVVDEVPDIANIPDLIKRKFVGVRPENVDKLYSELESWWFSLVIEHLYNHSQNPISLLALWEKISDINDRLKPGIIKDEFFFLPQPDDDPVWDTRCFVRQLRVIDLPRHLIRQAIHNFYRADKLRTWLVDELHLEELDEYDLQLKEEWTTYFYSFLVSEGDEQTYQQFGQSIYNRIQQEVDIPIHPQFTKKYVTRGSYQILADREPPEIGWHPKFKEYFEQPYSDA